MVSQDIRACSIALGTMMHEMNDEQAAVLRLVRSNLQQAADDVEGMEGSFEVPRLPPHEGLVVA